MRSRPRRTIDLKPRLLIDSEALDFVTALGKRDREFLRARFEEIRDSPARCSAYRSKDETGRDLDNHVTGRFAITYWDDFADRHVKIMAVRWADR
jgi:hypothetical protein